MTRRRQPEQQIQKAVLQHLKWRAVPGLFVFAVPNGGWRSAIEAAIFKGIGVISGVPDIIIIHSGQCFGLELKADRGRTTNVQRATHAAMRAAGAIVSTAYGIDEAVCQLEQWGLLKGVAS